MGRLKAFYVALGSLMILFVGFLAGSADQPTLTQQQLYNIESQAFIEGYLTALLNTNDPAIVCNTLKVLEGSAPEGYVPLHMKSLENVRRLCK